MPLRTPIRRAALATLVLALGTGCQREPSEPAPAADDAPADAAIALAEEAPLPYRARGNEPFWSIVLDASELRWSTPDTAHPVIWSGLTRSARADGFDLTAHREGRVLTLGATTLICRDNMSGMPHPHIVRVHVDDREFQGCGGEPLALLTAQQWTVAMIDGTAVAGPAPTLAFTEDRRASGFAGCNRWNAGAQLDGEGLRFGQAASTMMACPDNEMAQERAFLGALASVTRHDFDAAGHLLLMAGDGTRVVATPSPAAAPPAH